MKKMLFLRIVLFIWTLCLGAAAAMAQAPPASMLPSTVPTLTEVQQTRPTLTSPFTIALTYYKLTARAPDFEAWAKQREAYQNANDFDRPVVLENIVQKLKDSYNSLLLTDPIIMETQAQLSPYDATNQGFFVENFKRSTFFPASYEGQSYAIVPKDIEDKKWLKVDDPGAAAVIDKAAAANKGTLTMIMFLVPRYADPQPASIDGENYWPIAADVKNMMLYQPGSDTLLWQSTGPAALDKTRQNLLNLYH